MERNGFLWAGSDIFDRKSKVEYSDRKIPNANGVTYAIFYESEPYKGRATKNFAYMGFPNTQMPKDGYSAVVLAHGGGGAAFYEWVEYWNGKGYAAIAPDFYGNQYGALNKAEREHNPDGIDELPAGSFMNDKEEYRDSWTYHAVSNCILAYNALRDSGKVNPDKIAMTGISWGSVVTCITSGVDERFKAFVPVYGSGYIYKTPCFRKDDKYVSREKDEGWIACFDAVSYLPQNDKPTMFTFGADDSAFSPLNNMRASALCKGEVRYAVKESLFHDHRWRDDDEMRHVHAFIDYALNGTEMPFKVVSAAVLDNALVAAVDKPKNVDGAKLVFTSSDLRLYSTEWRWSSKPAAYKDGSFTAEIPTGASAWFMEFTDNKNNPKEEFIQSTKVFFRNGEETKI